MQLDNGQNFVVAYVSRSKNKVEEKYDLYACERFVWVVSSSSFMCYFYGNRFTLVMDQSLKFIMELYQFT
jgi:hypothetical protein